MIRRFASRCADLAARVFFAAALSLAPIAADAPPAFATVNTQASSTVVSGNGVQTVFSFGFIGVGAPYIQVLYTSPAGVQTQLVQGSGPTQYQVSLNSAVSGATWGVGGTVTYNPSSTPIPLGSTLTIYRSLPLLQGVSMSNQGNLAQLGKSSEQASDLVDMQVQQVNGLIGRAIVANVANPFPPLPLPPAAQVANQGLCFDSTGDNVIGCSVLPQGTVSTAMQPVVAAATLALGRTALELGAMANEGIGSGLQDDGAGNARVYFNVVSDATGQSVTAAFHLTQRDATGPITYTLPLASSLFNGFGFWVYAYSGIITFSPNASDNFVGLASGSSTSILAGQVAFVSTNAGSPGTWIINASPGVDAEVSPPGGRLTFVATTGGVSTPVMSVAETGKTSVCYTPYVGNQVPAWYGANFAPTPFSEYCQALSDTTLSPAAAVAGALYDEFEWVNAGSVVVTRGPAWTNATTRGYVLTRVNGFLTNASTVTNGPQAGYGLYIGTIAIDSGGATVSYNPTPAAASGGPSGGASIGLWNEFWRVPVEAVVLDNKTSWGTYSSASWRAADTSNNNRITFVAGQAEDSQSFSYQGAANAGGVNGAGVGIDSVTAFSDTMGTAFVSGQYSVATGHAATSGLVGQHYAQALESSTNAGAITFYGNTSNGWFLGQAMRLEGRLEY